ncbi:MAG TPA: outer membrane beta-barrel protein [Chitinophagaceae bacterium]|jgi:hypothetical protein|nr:outer membrane beta-barrel protein [Chitinophagaceae bacterium]
MNKVLFVFACTLISTHLFAQEPVPVIKKKEKIDLSNRANDHFVFQLGMAGWNGIPDTINKTGFSKTLNLYLMMDFPFKTNPHLSIGFGAGVASDHILFSKTDVGINKNTPQLLFTNVSDTDNYKKTKLATTYLEAPIEFRYSAKPLTGKGFKFVVGVKVGTLLNAHVRNAKYETKSGSSISDHVEKESSKKFFNKTRLSATARIGYGHLALFGSYQLTPLIRDGLGPVVKPFSIGITFTGL